MIYIVPETINHIVLTLNETSALSDPNYLFEFTNKFNGEITYWYAPDESGSPCRYNKFLLHETPTGSPTGGTDTHLSLFVGEYSYKVYESTAITLSVSATTGRIIEQGKMVVASTTGIFSNPNTNIYI